MLLGYSTLFGRAPSPINRSWLQARTSGARVEDAAHDIDGEQKLSITWSTGEQLEVLVRSPQDIDDLVVALEDADGNSARAIAELRAAVTEVQLASNTPLKAGSPPEALLRFLRAELAAIELRYGCVYDVAGNLLCQIPPEDEIARPTCERVRKRAQVLAAVVARGHIEHGPARKTSLMELWDWLDHHRLWSEAEVQEADLLRTSRGLLTRQDVVDATWRSEGLVVLLWALGLVELPAHDEQADTPMLTRTVGLFDKTIPPRFVRAQLRADGELDRMRGRLLGLHWRLRDFSLRPEAFDFVTFSRACWFGSFDISGVHIVDADLAIGGEPIAEAAPDAVRIAASIAMERHKAINWIHGEGEMYSEVHTST